MTEAQQAELSQLERDVLRTANQAIAKAIEDRLGAFNSPLAKMIDSVIGKHEAKLKVAVNTALDAAINGPEFQDELNKAVKQKIARSLIERLGGQIEKSVNELKSDPTTRARITLAIEQIVSGGGK